MIAFLNGGNINYKESGPKNGVPLLFVHGFPFSHEMWAPQVEGLKERYHIVTYDVRGLGNSDVGDGQYSIEGHVNDLIALMDHLHIARAVVVGLSMGGYIALRALEREPGRFMAAILCDTRSEADSNDAKIRRFAAMESVKKTGSLAFADTFVKAVFAPATFAEHPERVSSIHATISHTPPLAIAGTQLALAARTDTTESLERIRVPVLILVGEHDQTTPPDAARAMHERIPDSELHIVPEAAHLSTLENPVYVNRRLLAFLDNHFPQR